MVFLSERSICLDQRKKSFHQLSGLIVTLLNTFDPNVVQDFPAAQ